MLDDIKEILDPDNMVLPLQNGVFATAELSVKIDRKNILGGLCQIISKIKKFLKLRMITHS